MENITLDDCILTLLITLPNGNIHQCLIDESWLKAAINGSGDFRVHEKKIKGLTIKRIKNE